MGEPNITKYFTNTPSLFDEIAAKSNQSTESNINQLLEEEIVKPNVPNEVIDFWEFPTGQTASGIPPPLTFPGILLNSGYEDNISQVAVQLLGPESIAKRKDIVTENDVTQDDRGLRHLILSGCFGAALNLSSRLLSVYGQGYNKAGQVSKNTSHSLGLWFTRLSLLLRLGQFEVCQREAEAFGKLERPDVFYQHYPDLYAGRKGSMACFTFRLLIAELPIYRGNYCDAMNNLTDLLEICQRIQEKFTKESKEYGLFWLKRVNRVLHSIINCSLHMKNYALTTRLLIELIEKDTTELSEKIALQLALGRIYLQCGDLSSAETYFNKVFQPNQPKTLNEYINRGLLHIARAEYPEALTLFSEGLKIEPKNIKLHNNIAICYLYTGRLKNAIKQYEDAIDLNPAQALNENLILNLSTLYELESNNSRSKKLNLLKKIAIYKPDIDLNCLKLEYKKQEMKAPEYRENYVV